MKNSKRILSVTLKRMIDESPDTSWLGEYSNKPETEFAIDRATDEFQGDIDAGEEKLQKIEQFLEEARDLELDEDNADAVEWDNALSMAIDTVYGLRQSEPFDASWNSRELRYFNPGTVEPYDSKASWLESTTEPEKRAEWLAAMRSNAKQVYDRMESLYAGNWYFIGVRADAEVCIIPHLGYKSGMTQKITSGGLWGIESGSDKSYLEETEKEQLAELREQLKAIGFSSRAISTAFKNIERKEA